MKGNKLKYRLCGQKGTKEINLNSKDAAKQVKELFSKLKAYSDGIDCIMDFCKKNGIFVECKSCLSFKFSDDVFVHFYFFLNEFSSEFCQVSVASDGCVRFHKNGWQWTSSYANTDLNLFDKKDVAELKSMLDGLKVKEAKNSDNNYNDDRYSSDDGY